MQSVAQGWLMHRLTSSAFMLGFLGFLQFLPVLLLALWAGVIADRFDRRKLLLITQSAALVQAVLLALLVSFGVVQPWMVLALAFGFGVVNAFDLPLRQSFVVELVGREDLPNAIALNSAAFNSARIIGPAIAGPWWRRCPAWRAPAGSPAGSAATSRARPAALDQRPLVRRRADRARPPPRAAPRAPGHRGLDAVDARRRRALRARHARDLAPADAARLLTAGLSFQYLTLLPVYARDLLHGGAGTFGALVSAFGIGSLCPRC